MKFAGILIFIIFINASGQTAQTNNSDDIFYDNCIINAQPESALLTHDHSGTKQFDYFDNKWTVLASISYRPGYTRTEVTDIDSDGNGGLKAGPNPIHIYYDKVVSWIKETYQTRIAKDNYGATRLLLLGFGLIGLVGIRRKLKKIQSAHNPVEKKGWIKKIKIS